MYIFQNFTGISQSLLNFTMAMFKYLQRVKKPCTSSNNFLRLPEPDCFDSEELCDKTSAANNEILKDFATSTTVTVNDKITRPIITFILQNYGLR